MLKIRDNVDLKELEKYGFKKKYYYNAICIVREDRKHDIFFDLKTRKLLFINYGYDTLYDLIKDGLVERVGDDNELA